MLSDKNEMSETGSNSSNDSFARLQPAAILYSPKQLNVFLGDTYAGASAFLVCSGPSLSQIDPNALNRRGILSCSVNNAATVVRSNIWVSFDDPGNFSDLIWRDPTILKLIPASRFDATIRIRDKNGELIESEDTAGEMPNTFGFRSNSKFVPSQWLYEDSVNCGHAAKEHDSNDIIGSRSVMMVAVKLLFYLGVRRLFLLGCDFRMSYGQQNYAFKQNRTRASVRGNNRSYRVMNTRFQELLPYFEKANFKIFNCTPNSGLIIFPFLEFEDAIEMALKTMPQTNETEGMYEPGWRKSCSDDTEQKG